MLTAYERHLLACYLAKAAAGLHHRDREASALAEWVADRENRVACGRRSKRSRLRGTELDPEEGMSAEKLRRLAEALQEECAATKKARFDRTAQRLQSLAPTADLSRTDVAILELLLRYQSQPIIESMVDDVFGPTARHINPLNLKGPALSVLLGISANTVHRRFRNDAPLVRSGLVSIDNDGDLTLVGRLHRLATIPGDSSVDVTHLLLGTASASDLEWSDFDHVAADRDYAERLMKGALDSGASGVNVLLYGPPGTGKTQFCKVLAERLGVTLFSVGESDDDGNEPARGERLQELRLAQRLLAGNRRSLLLFDEMEDLLCDAFPNFGFFGRSFNSRGREGNSKVFMHRLLEQAPTPTLWTMNNARDVSDAILRRMMFALELRPPTVRVRARMWARQLERHGIEAGPDEAHSLAAEFEATPGVAAGATAAARLGGGDIAAVRHGVRSLSRVLSCERPPQATPARFDPGLINADTEPATLAERLVDLAERRFSLCLQGPPGTGKSAFVRYLADRLGLEVIQKRASDLMSMWVGEHGAANRRRVRRGARHRRLPRFRRSRLDARRPTVRPEVLGGESGQRDADLDGEPSPALRLHDQLRRAPRPGDVAALRLQGDARLSDARAGRDGVSGLFCTHPSGGARDPHGPDSRGLRGGAQKGRDSGAAAAVGSAGCDAVRGVRREAGPTAAHRLSAVGNLESARYRESPDYRPCGTGSAMVMGRNPTWEAEDG